MHAFRRFDGCFQSYDFIGKAEALLFFLCHRRGFFKQFQRLPALCPFFILAFHFCKFLRRLSILRQQIVFRFGELQIDAVICGRCTAKLFSRFFERSLVRLILI